MILLNCSMLVTCQPPPPLPTERPNALSVTQTCLWTPPYIASYAFSGKATHTPSIFILITLNSLRWNLSYLPALIRPNESYGETRDCVGSNAAVGGRPRWARLSCDARCDVLNDFHYRLYVKLDVKYGPNSLIFSFSSGASPAHNVGGRVIPVFSQQILSKEVDKCDGKMIVAHYPPS